MSCATAGTPKPKKSAASSAIRRSESAGGRTCSCLHRRSCSAFQASCAVRPLKQSGGAAAADASTGAAAGSSRVMTNNGSPAESCTSHVYSQSACATATSWYRRRLSKPRG